MWTRVEQDVRKLYEIVWGQCTKRMQDKVKSFEGFATVESARNGIELLKIIKTTANDTLESHKDPIQAYVEALTGLFSVYQGKLQSLLDFKKRFDERVAVCEAVGGKLTLPKTLTDLIECECRRRGECRSDPRGGLPAVPCPAVAVCRLTKPGTVG